MSFPGGILWDIVIQFLMYTCNKKLHIRISTLVSMCMYTHNSFTVCTACYTYETMIYYAKHELPR